ncbi:PREDICTED: nephronectin [Apaloderma vittatum]|uniref:nephronectin n=1 Tax=Apaloderma vittatum TaxID=57397 RepID=UPI0005216873|nr:PREDICTED: nephronectin [Apaloderma vittatum]
MNGIFPSILPPAQALKPESESGKAARQQPLPCPAIGAGGTGARQPMAAAGLVRRALTGRACCTGLSPADVLVLWDRCTSGEEKCLGRKNFRCREEPEDVEEQGVKLSVNLDEKRMWASSRWWVRRGSGVMALRGSSWAQGEGSLHFHQPPWGAGPFLRLRPVMRQVALPAERLITPGHVNHRERSFSLQLKDRLCWEAKSIITVEFQLPPELLLLSSRYNPGNCLGISDPLQRQGRGLVPRQPGVSNNLFEILEIERGITADEFEANDDPGVLVHSCDFDSGLCGWLKDKDDNLHWEPVRDESGGQYLTISDPQGKEGRAAHLILPLAHAAQAGDLCLSFRHKVPGLQSAALQVFVRKNGAHGPAVWGRNGGHGWRQTHITLGGLGIKSVIFKGEKGKGRTGDIGLDDVILRRGRCSEEH